MKIEDILKLQTILQKEPLGFYDVVLGCGHWEKQDDITHSVFKNQRTTVGSCHGAGKSYIAARVGMAFLYAYQNSIVLTTAPTFRQVEDVIWREWRSAHANARVDLGTAPLLTKQEISERWFARGISADKADNMQGYHGPYILIIVDEAAGMRAEVMDAIEGLLTSENVRLLYIGNTTTGTGHFFNSHKSNLFHKIKISVFDTPNFTSNGILNLQDLQKFERREDVEKLPIAFPQLVTPLWAWERMQEWGEDTPIFKARVLAQFPEEGEDTLIGLHLVDQAVNKTWKPEELAARPRANVVGIDVARFGSDQTVLTAMQSHQMLDLDWYNGKDTQSTAGRGIDMFKHHSFDKNLDSFVVDDTGVGGGVTDALRAAGYNVLAVNFGSSPESEDFANLKAEIMWNMRQVFRAGDISILDKGKLVAQIPMIRYDYSGNGKLVIVSKKQMKKEGIESPDFADSLALALWGVRCGGSFAADFTKGKGGTVGGNLYRKVF